MVGWRLVYAERQPLGVVLAGSNLTANGLGTFQRCVEGGETPPGPRRLILEPNISVALAQDELQLQPSRTCRRAKRAWIGTLIGAAASVPLAVFAHKRWNNEAASGTTAAAWTVVLGAGGGAFVGLATYS